MARYRHYLTEVVVQISSIAVKYGPYLVRDARICEVESLLIYSQPSGSSKGEFIVLSGLFPQIHHALHMLSACHLHQAWSQ
jgi:hypothetical protein